MKIISCAHVLIIDSQEIVALLFITNYYNTMITLKQFLSFDIPVELIVFMKCMHKTVNKINIIFKYNKNKIRN